MINFNLDYFSKLYFVLLSFHFSYFSWRNLIFVEGPRTPLNTTFCIILFSILGGGQSHQNYEDPSGFIVTPDGLYIPQQQYMYYSAPEPQYTVSPPVVSADTAALKNMIKKQV